jgi:hypothetical protein
LRRMRSEREKMLAGELYNALDPELVTARNRARDLCQALNRSREEDAEERRRILKDLFAAGGDTVWMQPPLYCDYGDQPSRSTRRCIHWIPSCVDARSMENRSRSAQTSGSAAERSFFPE